MLTAIGKKNPLARPKVPDPLGALRAACALVLAALGVACAAPAQERAAALALRPMHEISAAIRAGEVTSESMVDAYLTRIEALDRSGPQLNAVLALNPQARAEARALDAALAAGAPPGPLHGVPILLKDNIESADAMATTAGSLALAANVTGRDAPLVARLRAAGAIVLGKTNLSEWANFRSSASISGWSGLGGQVRNPYAADRSPCGSSSGSAVAARVALAAAAIGTETNGSIICPASMTGAVGFKPTVGLISVARIVPIAATQDTAGPITRDVRDAALLLQVMAGPDAQDFSAALSENALQGASVGVLRFALGADPDVITLFDTALATLESAGATLVDIEAFEAPDGFWEDSLSVLLAEFRAGIDAYFAADSPHVEVDSLDALIAFNQAHAQRELALFGQDMLERALQQPGLDDAGYQSARARILRATREDGIDRLMQLHGVAFLVAPSAPPAFLIDPVHGDSYPEGVGAGWLAAIAGYPHLTVPMGVAHGLPVGLSFISTAGRDADVLAAGYAYERRRAPSAALQFLETLNDSSAMRSALAPMAR